MYQAWLYYGEFLVFGIWGMVLTLVRRILFGRLCRDAALGSGAKGKMLKAMTLKFEKSYEVNVGVHDIPVFVQKYLCQEKKFGIRLGRWRRLPERWTGLILGIGFLETMILHFLGYESTFYLNRFLAAATSAAFVRVAVLWFETDSLWERAQVCLLDYVSNTLYPRQIHTYEGFAERAEEAEQVQTLAEEKTECAEQEKPIIRNPAKNQRFLDKEEEQILQEVMTELLGSSV